MKEGEASSTSQSQREPSPAPFKNNQSGVNKQQNASDLQQMNASINHCGGSNLKQQEFTLNDQHHFPAAGIGEFIGGTLQSEKILMGYRNDNEQNQEFVQKEQEEAINQFCSNSPTHLNPSLHSNLPTTQDHIQRDVDDDQSLTLQHQQLSSDFLSKLTITDNNHHHLLLPDNEQISSASHFYLPHDLVREGSTPADLDQQNAEQQSNDTENNESSEEIEEPINNAGNAINDESADKQYHKAMSSGLQHTLQTSSSAFKRIKPKSIKEPTNQLDQSPQNQKNADSSAFQISETIKMMLDDNQSTSQASTSAKDSNYYQRGTKPKRSERNLLLRLTVRIVETLKVCNPRYNYQPVNMFPKRDLTYPSEGVLNNGYDNVDSDYILRVSDLIITPEGKEYEILDLLGKGTFGQVVKCECKQVKETVAIKVIKNKKAFKNQGVVEIKILDIINRVYDPSGDSSLVRMLDFFVFRDHLCIVFELLSVSIYDLLKENSFQGLSLNFSRLIISQIIEAMKVVKEAKLIHCDLKPENILFKSKDNPNIKVIDFGSASFEGFTVFQYIQSRYYRSPEILLGLPYDAAIDMWSVGCICAELFLGIPIFPGNSEYDQLSRIIEILGHIPQHLIQRSRYRDKYFYYNPQTGQFRFKTFEEFQMSTGINLDPPRRYIENFSCLDDLKSLFLIRKQKEQQQAAQHAQKRVQSLVVLESEMNAIEAFIDFLKGILRIDKDTRWTPSMAMEHPFITREVFTGPFEPRREQTSSHDTHGEDTMSEQSSSSKDSKDYKAGSCPSRILYPQTANVPQYMQQQIRPQAPLQMNQRAPNQGLFQPNFGQSQQQVAPPQHEFVFYGSGQSNQQVQSHRPPILSIPDEFFRGFMFGRLDQILSMTREQLIQFIYEQQEMAFRQHAQRVMMMQQQQHQQLLMHQAMMMQQNPQQLPPNFHPGMVRAPHPQFQQQQHLNLGQYNSSLMPQQRMPPPNLSLYNPQQQQQPLMRPTGPQNFVAGGSFQGQQMLHGNPQFLGQPHLPQGSNQQQMPNPQMFMMLPNEQQIYNPPPYIQQKQQLHMNPPQGIYDPQQQQQQQAYQQAMFQQQRKRMMPPNIAGGDGQMRGKAGSWHPPQAMQPQKYNHYYNQINNPGQLIGGRQVYQPPPNQFPDFQQQFFQQQFYPVPIPNQKPQTQQAAPHDITTALPQGMSPRLIQPGGSGVQTGGMFTKIDLKQTAENRRNKFSASKANNQLGSNESVTSLSQPAILEEEKEQRKKDSHIPYPENKFLSMGVNDVSTFRGVPGAPPYNVGLGGKKPSVENLQIMHQLSDSWSAHSGQSFRQQQQQQQNQSSIFDNQAPLMSQRQMSSYSQIPVHGYGGQQLTGQVYGDTRGLPSPKYQQQMSFLGGGPQKQTSFQSTPKYNHPNQQRLNNVSSQSSLTGLQMSQQQQEQIVYQTPIAEQQQPSNKLNTSFSSIHSTGSGGGTTLQQSAGQKGFLNKLQTLNQPQQYQDLGGISDRSSKFNFHRINSQVHNHPVPEQIPSANSSSQSSYRNRGDSDVQEDQIAQVMNSGGISKNRKVSDPSLIEDAFKHPHQSNIMGTSYSSGYQPGYRVAGVPQQAFAMSQSQISQPMKYDQPFHRLMKAQNNPIMVQQNTNPGQLSLEQLLLQKKRQQEEELIGTSYKNQVDSQYDSPLVNEQTEEDSGFSIFQNQLMLESPSPVLQTQPQNLKLKQPNVLRKSGQQYPNKNLTPIDESAHFTATKLQYAQQQMMAQQQHHLERNEGRFNDGSSSESSKNENEVPQSRDPYDVEDYNNQPLNEQEEGGGYHSSASSNNSDRHQRYQRNPDEDEEEDL